MKILIALLGLALALVPHKEQPMQVWFSNWCVNVRIHDTACHLAWDMYPYCQEEWPQWQKCERSIQAHQSLLEYSLIHPAFRMGCLKHGFEGDLCHSYWSQYQNCQATDPDKQQCGARLPYQVKEVVDRFEFGLPVSY